MFLSFYRVLKTGIQGFWRNRWVSQATIGVMTLTLFVVASVTVFNAMGESLIDDLRNRVDITVFFKTTTDEEDILRTKTNLETLPEVTDVSYTSREEALATFKEKHKDNPLILQSLDEIGSNPLTASLSVKATDPSEFSSIADFLNNNYEAIVDKVNYRENQEVIEKLAMISGNVERGGLALSFALIVIVMLVIFNTIRLTIYSVRDEVAIKRLVGASNWFIRGPFLVEGLLYGVISSLLTFGVLVVVSSSISGRLESVLLGFSIVNYVSTHAWAILGLLFAMGAGLGIFSSWIAVRRYLKI